MGEPLAERRDHGHATPGMAVRQHLGLREIEEPEHIQITAVAKRALLLVIYEEGVTSLGPVRMRARKTDTELTKSIQAILDKTPAQETAPLPELTEKAIETLFSK